MQFPSLLSAAAFVALLAPLSGLAQAAVEPPIKLDPLVVTGIRPLIKIAEHPMIEPRFAAAVVAEGDYLYIIGGSNEDGTRLDSVERVDLRTGRAEAWAKLHIARRHHRAVILAGKIYVLGGTSGPVTRHDRLSTELSDYAEDDPPLLRPPNLLGPPENLLIPPSLPPSRIDPRTPRERDEFDDGGRLPTEGFRYEPTMEVIDLATGQAGFGPAMPTPKALFGCVVLGGKILAIGGQTLRGTGIVCTSATEVFDPVTNKWSAGVNLPTPRRGTASVVDGFVIFLGGFDGHKAGRMVEVFNPREGLWRRLLPLTEPVNPSATVWAGKYLFLFGDRRSSKQLVYDLRKKELVQYPLRLPDSDFATALEHHGRIYVIGGVNFRLHETTEAIQVFALTAEPRDAAPGVAGK